MSRIRFEPSFTVGIPEIDLQHRQILEIFENLEELQDRDTRSRAVQKVMDELRYNIQHHIVTEENYLDYARPASLQQQRHDHEDFVETICSYQRDFLRRSAVSVTDLVADLGQRFVDHLREVDVPSLSASAAQSV